MPHEFPQLDKAQLIQAAEERAGLPSHRSTIVDQALDQLIDSLNREAQFSALGHQIATASFNRILANQILLHHELAKPITNLTSSARATEHSHLFVLGLFRSGTTLLHNLLSLDPNAHYIRLCDGQFPVPAPKSDQDQDKIAQSEQMTQKIYSLTPDLAKLHYIHPTRPDECYWLFEYQLLAPIFHLRMNVPSYYRWLLQTPDHSESYRHYHHVLNYLGQHHTFNHWVLKAPRHLFFLRELLDVFPNAHIVWLHRDPVKSIPSLCSLSHLLRSNYSDRANPQDTGKIWSEIMQERLRTALDTRKGLSVDQRPFYDLQYADLMADPVRSIQSIYEYFSLPFSPTLAERITQWLTDNPQHKHGKHEYCAQDFGLEPDHIRQQFAFYTEFFDIPINL